MTYVHVHIQMNKLTDLRTYSYKSWHMLMYRMTDAIKSKKWTDFTHWYQPEAEVGKALKDLMTEKKMKRKEFFVASSVGNTYHSKEKASSLLKQFHLPARFD